jgi:hypothetical protein
MKIELLKEENFRALVDSYAVLFSEDSAELMVQRALRAHANNLGGCISCVFSRFAEPAPVENENHMDFFKRIWFQRACVLGLREDKCNEHLEFPPQKE